MQQHGVLGVLSNGKGYFSRKMTSTAHHQHTFTAAQVFDRMESGAVCSLQANVNHQRS